MAALKILGKSSSINVRKVLWTCAEIGLDFDLTEFGSGTPNSVTTPEFLILNPNAMVPVIQYEGQVLWESNTICRYLAARHQRTDLLPQDPMARAQVEKWMDWQATELNNAWRYAFMALVRHSPAHRDTAAIEHSVREWNRHMSIADLQLQRTGAYLVGDQFTLADIVLGLSLNRWRASPIAHANLPALQTYFDLLCKRSGYTQYGANGIA
ncbi:glutathione S-transferase N-terminal domain-containing protein [Undibacterium amnicola]|uniref:Glutathione S-transferase N-terminal domain-containing protein n=1 Tax=Undibacterium amnicola TaxID=1834038 RepID=A0ABR6XKA9_9BURK|nr:glutathione S-transferase N-terminal domain-containing protein [Undibacterium amnicola]MBC3829946.1 glutathione S-transferase N-terminal domain-containing protein [Undibacterium amnicola]